MPQGHALSEAAKERIWELRAQGLSEREIGRRLGVAGQSVSLYLRRLGGIRPRPRRRPDRCLSFAEREEISRGIARGHSARQIARTLERSHTTIAREINRGGGRSHYRAHKADREAWRRARRPRPTKLEHCRELRALVEERLADDHSPEQIAGWLRFAYPDNEAMHVSHETIYRALYVQARGELRRELTRHLRRGRSRRYARSQSSKRQGQGKLTDKVMISERPPEAADRAVPGHWEGDLLMGNRQSAGRDRHPGRALDPLPAAHRPTRWRRGDSGRRRPGAEHHHPARPAMANADLGSGPRDGRAPPLHGQDRSRRLLLRPPEPLAAGHQREHQRPAAPILPAAHQPRGSHPVPARRGRRQAQPPAAKDARLSQLPRRSSPSSSTALTAPPSSADPLRPSAFAPQRSTQVKGCETSGVVQRSVEIATASGSARWTSETGFDAALHRGDQDGGGRPRPTRNHLRSSHQVMDPVPSYRPLRNPSRQLG